MKNSLQQYSKHRIERINMVVCCNVYEANIDDMKVPSGCFKSFVVHTYHSLTGFEPLDFRKSKERSPLEDGGGACCCNPGGPGGRGPDGPAGGMPGPPGGCGQLLLNIPLLYIMLGPPTCATLPSIKEVVAVSCSPPTSP